jgi:hypothetical protein
LNVSLDHRGANLGDLMSGTVPSLDVRRAYVDVTSTDVPGIVPPLYRPTTPVPALPLFTNLAEPLPNVSAVLTGSLDGLPTATLDPAEKATYSGGKISISPVSRPTHLAAAGADLSLAVWSRSEPSLA